jgi:hypothetical protein
MSHMTTTEESKNCAPEERFRSNLINFVQYMSTIVKPVLPEMSNPIVIGYVLSVINNANSSEMMYKFIDRSNKHWDDSFDKKESSLLSNISELFEDLPQDKVSKICSVFNTTDEKGNLVINNSQREIIWSYIHSFIKISIKYIHKTRCPVKNDAGIKKYTVKYFDGLSCRLLSEKWKIILED